MSNGGEGTYGYLALLQLLASAAADERLTAAQRRALIALARYAAQDGTCCVSLSRLADVLHCKRQAVQDALRTSVTGYIAKRKPERVRSIIALSGYLSSEERQRKTGADGAKIYRFNLDLAGAHACPLPRPQGVQAPELAGGSKRQSLQGVQAPELAHKKPSEETNSEETNACGASAGERRARGKAASCLQGEASRRQPPLLLPINGDSANAKCTSQAPGAALRQRVQAFNQDAERTASGRLWSAWAKVDPDLKLYDSLRASGEEVARKAGDIEAQRPGHGVRYLAGAAAKASRGRWTAAEILAGRAAARRAAP